MGLLDTIKSWFASPTIPTPVVVEEEVDLGELFKQACYKLGIGAREINKTNAVEIYKEWYTGPRDLESVAASIREFVAAHPNIEEHFKRFLK